MIFKNTCSWRKEECHIHKLYCCSYQSRVPLCKFLRKQCQVLAHSWYNQSYWNFKGHQNNNIVYLINCSKIGKILSCSRLTVMYSSAKFSKSLLLGFNIYFACNSIQFIYFFLFRIEFLPSKLDNYNKAFRKSTMSVEVTESSN